MGVDQGSKFSMIAFQDVWKNNLMAADGTAASLGDGIPHRLQVRGSGAGSRIRGFPAGGETV